MASSLTVNNLLLNEPDWINNLKYSVKFNTNIQTSITGIERRAALRIQPDRSLNFRIAEYNNDAIKLRSKLYKNIGNSNWGVPLWTDYSKLNAQANITSTSISVTTTNKHFYAGGYCIIMYDKDTYEYKKILSLTASSINFSTGLDATWIANTAVFPLIVTKIGKSIDINYVTSRVFSTNITANELYYSDNNYEAVEPTYFYLHDESSGKPLYVFSPDHNWISDRKIKISNQYNDLKFLADSYQYNHWTETDAIHSFYLTISNLEDIYQLENFFNHVKGRCHSFFLPSGATDIILSANALSTDSTLSIENTGFADYYTDSGTPYTTSEHIEIISSDGTKIYCKIISATNTQITLNGSIGTAITDYANCKVSLMAEARFMNDELNINYLSQTVAKVQLSCKWQQGDLVERYSMNYTSQAASDWVHYATITIDSGKINNTLSDFPFTLNISSSSGTGNTDLTGLFSLIGATYKKLQVRATNGATVLYAAVEEWDNSNNFARLHIKIPSISNSVDTVVKLYYYNNAATPVNNYIDMYGTTIGESVWDVNFSMVQHMSQDPSNSSPQMIDSTNNDLDGACVNMDVSNLVDGLNSKALSFNGVNQRVDLGNVLDSPTDFTVSLLFRMDNTLVGGQSVFVKGDAAAGRVDYFIAFDNGNITLNYNPAGTWYNYTDTSANLQIGTFYNITVSVTQTATLNITFYKDGEFLSSTSLPNLLAHNGYNCYIGHGSYTYYFEGLINNVRFSNIARSAAYIMAENYTLRDNLAEITLI